MTGNQCVVASACPSGTYGNINNYQCSSCLSPCATCSSATICITCIQYYIFSNGFCISNCAVNQIPLNGICTNCTSPCSTCIDYLTYCLSCLTLNPPVFLSGSSCLNTCPDTFYANSSSLICASCVPPCWTCTSTLTCLSCNSTTHFYQNRCLINCPSGYAPLNNVCTACASPCETCSNSISFCLTCVTNIIPIVYLTGNRCTQICPDGTYPNNTSFTCINCSNLCSTCTSNIICSSCITSYSLYNTNCISNCPSGYVSVNSVCIKCDSSCATCITTTTNCLTCINNYYFFINTNSCLLTCPLGFYNNFS